VQNSKQLRVGQMMVAEKTEISQTGSHVILTTTKITPQHEKIETIKVVNTNIHKLMQEHITVETLKKGEKYDK